MPSDAGAGPYRGAEVATGSAPAGATLADLVQARRDELAAMNRHFAPSREELEAELVRTQRKYRLGLALMALFAIGAITAITRALLRTPEVGLAQLRADEPPMDRVVRVTCTEIDGPLWQVTDSRGRSTVAYSMCAVGDPRAIGSYLLPIEHDSDETLAPGAIEGTLSWVRSDARWVRDGLATEPALEARALAVYLDTEGRTDQLHDALFGVLVVLATPILWVAYRRWRRRMLATIAAASKWAGGAARDMRREVDVARDARLSRSRRSGQRRHPRQPGHGNPVDRARRGARDHQPGARRR